ncbi:MAG: VOC family protein [Planctomycetota bacterium]|jgi:predicted lactoylglutathione lyase
MFVLGKGSSPRCDSRMERRFSELVLTYKSDIAKRPAAVNPSSKMATWERSMINQVFLTLPVADLQKSIAFFKALGFTDDRQFSDDTAARIIINESISVMLGTHEKFRTFTPKAICDTSQAVEVLISLSCDSRDQVDELVARALAAGGTTYDQPEDLGFMYSHSFVDLDGHGWGVLHMTS